MGCGELSKIKKHQTVKVSLKPRVNKTFIRGETISTDNSSRFSSRIGTEKRLDVDKICLKFKIFDSFEDFAARELNSKENSKELTDTFANDLRYIKKN